MASKPETGDLTQRAAPPVAVGRLPQLDGWRAISIACVLASHLLPLGPKFLRLNEAAGLLGMNLFFTLSGFLIGSFLLEKPDVSAFAYRRLFRILPLAWLYLAIVLTVLHAPFGVWRANFLFTANYEDPALGYLTGHMWSLCVEIHFYLLAGIAVLLFGRRGLWLFPILLPLVTLTRVVFDDPMSIRTHLRMDDILVGGTLALIVHAPRGISRFAVFRQPPFLYAALLLVCSMSMFGPALYLRPYAAALLVGSTLAQPTGWLSQRLARPSLAYVARISYALYIIHPAAAHGWFAESSKLVLYLVKRPLTLLITFALAHLSTFYYEERWIKLGRRLSNRSRGARPAHAVPPVTS
jgi:peptidoglycan/LPS O-acetylase OafA/YrhL